MIVKSNLVKQRIWSSNTDRAIFSQHNYMVDENICLKCHDKQKYFSMLNDLGLCRLCSDK